MHQPLPELISELSHMDERWPIIGSFLIERIPAGYPPFEIRELWQGKHVPVRFPRFLAVNEVKVTYGDIEASLLAQSEEPAAHWFEEYRFCRRYALHIPDWTFSANDGTVAVDSPVSTADYYRHIG